MRTVTHPIYGPGTPTGKANGIFIEVKFDRDIGDCVWPTPSRKRNTIYVSKRVCK